MSTTPTKRGPYKRGPKSTETGPVVGVHEEPATKRQCTQNRYNREALRDFYDGTALKEANAHFDYLVKNARGVTEKQAFAATIFEHAPTI